MNEYLMIATVLKPQGVHGECKLRSYAADIDLFYKWSTLYVKNENGFYPVSVHVSRIKDGFVYAVLNHSDDADSAEKYRGIDLYVDRAHAKAVEGNEVLIEDLIGCEAYDRDGKTIGKLSSVLQYGTVDTWVFNTENGTLMVPALISVFPEVDAEKKIILVNRERLEEVAVRS